MKLILISICVLAMLSAFVIVAKKEIFFNKKNNIIAAKNVKPTIVKTTKELQVYGNKLKPFLKANNYCQAYCFLIDMAIPSGKKRFFVYDLKADSILAAGLVTHGGGSQTNTDSLTFCNIPNSGATSLGRYKIGAEYSGKFGMAFKLHGLDDTNSKAYERFVVLHSHACVPAAEVHPSLICTSLGCPTVSPQFLPTLKKYIDKANAPVLLYVYCSK